MTHPWQLNYTDWNPEQQMLREALTTLGNGYFATRGAAEEADAKKADHRGPHYPGTYLAGGYNRLSSKVADREIENEDLVNWPNWLYLTFKPKDGEWFDLDNVTIHDYRQTLDLYCGILEREVHFEDAEGRRSSLLSRRIVHMNQPHLAAIEWTLVPENWCGQIVVRSALDGRVTNCGVARYADLRGDHLEVLGAEKAAEDSVCLRVRTKQSRIEMVQAARTRAYDEVGPIEAKRVNFDEDGFVGQDLIIECSECAAVRIQKIVALYSSRDNAISEPGIEASKAASEAPTFDELLATHSREWNQRWDRYDIEIADGDHDTAFMQMNLRLHVFHLLQVSSIHTAETDWGIPARGLHGEAYRGHIFWDELYVFPLINLRVPEVSRALLLYRYRRLPEARRMARQAGYGGAMFPWQSGSNGREESQVVHLNPRSGNWVPDETHLQRHINAAIAYNVWHYYQGSGDIEFLNFFGAELIVEIAAFFSSIAELNEERGRYEIRGVVGPDEYHTRYPGAEAPGLNNNAYTNVMAVWVLRRAMEILRVIGEHRRREIIADVGLTDAELERWNDITKRMFVPFIEEGIISQFEGYEELEELDWETYRKEHGVTMRLDRILEAEGDTPNRYKAGKQADVLMLFYLFSTEELAGIFESLGYDFSGETIPKNVDYYIERTSHGSTLSAMVYAWVLSRSDRKRSSEYFEEALRSDIEDIQGGTTKEGIHLGAMAGTVDLLERCYSGIEMRNDALWFNPCLPENIRQMTYRLRYRGHWLHVRVTQETLTLSFEWSWAEKVNIGVNGKIHEFTRGQTREFQI